MRLTFILSALSFLIATNTYGFESYDDKLRKLSDIDKTFAGLYSDDSGNTVITLSSTNTLFSSRNSASLNKDLTVKSHEEVQQIIDPDLAYALSDFYGRDKLLQEPDFSETAAHAELSNIRATRLGKSVKIRRVKYSFSDLYDWYQTVKFKILSKKYVYGTDIDEKNNKLAIFIKEGKFKINKKKIKKIMKRHGIPKDAYSIQTSDPVSFNVDLRDQITPIPGGPQIFRRISPTRSSVCSTGFAGTINGQRGIITAAHCTIAQGIPNDGTAFFQGSGSINTFIGDSTIESQRVNAGCPSSRTACYNSDAAFIPLPANVQSQTSILKTRTLNSIPVDLNLKISGRKTWYNLLIFGQTAVGDKAYKTGRTTGTTSGTVTNTCINVNLTSGVRLNCHTRVASDTAARFSDGGDSGAAVVGSINGTDFWNYTYTHGRYAKILGLNVASNSSGTLAFFSPIDSIIQDLGTITNFR